MACLVTCGSFGAVDESGAVRQISMTIRFGLEAWAEFGSG